MSPRLPPTKAGQSSHDGLTENALPSFPHCPLLQPHLREALQGSVCLFCVQEVGLC